MLAKLLKEVSALREENVQIKDTLIGQESDMKDLKEENEKLKDEIEIFHDDSQQSEVTQDDLDKKFSDSKNLIEHSKNNLDEDISTLQTAHNNARANIMMLQQESKDLKNKFAIIRNQNVNYRKELLDSDEKNEKFRNEIWYQVNLKTFKQ
eukprot:UN27729